MLRKSVSAFVGIALAFVGTSCSVGLDIVLYNNTNQKVVLLIDNKERSVEIASLVRFPYPLSGKMGLKNDTSASSWEYEVIYPDPEFETHRWAGLGVREVHCQLERDLGVYILPPRLQLPVKMLPPQPSGYPLVPKLMG